MNIGMELGAANVIDPLNTGSMPSSQEMDTMPVPESELASAPVAVEETYLCDYTESKDILGEGDGSTSPIMPHMEQQLLPIETPNFRFRTPSYWQEEVKGLNEISDFPVYTYQMSVNRELPANTGYYTKNYAAHVSTDLTSNHTSY